ncbi:MAG TPA: hypothetical protein VMF65_23375 [Acidimicrobiales bacterium]|nr:hypothetical protein [Acidimicrobiales bacterium]
MPHVPDGTLRRLTDEPLAVADGEAQHVSSCARCRARNAEISSNASFAAGVFARPVSLSDGDLAWARHQGRLSRASENRTDVQARRPRYWRLMGTSAGTGATVALAGAVLAGVAAAATLSTTVFAPTKVAPVAVNSADIRAIAGVLGIDSPSELLGFARPSGSETLPFGTLHWTSSGDGRQVASLSEAEASTGLSVSLPSTLPDGISSPSRFLVVPTLTATIVLGPNAGHGLSGSSLVATLGPGIGVTYAGATAGTGIDPLAILTMARPVATSTGATTSQLEKFLLSQPGMPPGLAQELQVLGNLQTTLPVPAPRGANSATIQVGGSPAVLLTDKGNDAAAAIWEAANGEVHIVAGLLNGQDLRSVAEQVG